MSLAQQSLCDGHNIGNVMGTTESMLWERPYQCRNYTAHVMCLNAHTTDNPCTPQSFSPLPNQPYTLNLSPSLPLSPCYGFSHREIYRNLYRTTNTLTTTPQPLPFYSPRSLLSFKRTLIHATSLNRSLSIFIYRYLVTP